LEKGGYDMWKRNMRKIEKIWEDRWKEDWDRDGKTNIRRKIKKANVE
jgi:hypothetical protein